MVLTRPLIFLIGIIFATEIFAQNIWITNASGVKLRSEASLNSAEIEKLPLGTIINQIDDESHQDRIANKVDYWRKVSLSNGKEGWIFGSYLLRYNSHKRDEIYIRIASERIKVEDVKYYDCVDLVNFLYRATTEVTERKYMAELELIRLHAIQKIFQNLPNFPTAEKRYLGTQQIVQIYQPYIVLNELYGYWQVKAESLWDLQSKYSDLPLADRIAWEAASTERTGECEGDDGCYLSYTESTFVRYWNLYPKGKFISDALKGATDRLGDFNRGERFVWCSPGDENYRSYRKDIVSRVRKIRASLVNVKHLGKTNLLSKLALYENFYGRK